MITTMTPSSENIRGTSALPYHIIKGRNAALYENETLTLRNADATKNNVVDIEIYSFNNNGLTDEKIAEVEKELQVTIKKVPMPKWFLWVFKFRLLFIRLFLKYPIHHYVKMPQRYVDEIKAKKPDIIWVYGAEWSKVVNQFDGFKRIHTLPDSEALYYYRMLGQRFVTHDWNMFWRCALMYPKFLALERNYSTDPTITYHLVGEEDVQFLRKMNPGINARFVRHPHYEVSSKLKILTHEGMSEQARRENGKFLRPSKQASIGAERKIKFHQPKIKVLIAGRYDLYMKQEADELLEELKNPRIEELKEHYVFTFLGKGWEKHAGNLTQAGYEVAHITFAPDYIEEISKHDIQITPIAIGTGTKGKVLDALANGLLVIGTPYAMENIAVENGRSCVEYNNPEDVMRVLMDIPGNIQKYEEMAAAGRENVLRYHDRRNVSQQFFFDNKSGVLVNQNAKQKYEI